MILQLGMSSEFIKVTAAYSNAVMAAMLPHFTDFARKLDLPVPVPITAASVFHCGVLPYTTLDGSMAGGSVILTNGYSFSFQFGYVNGFSRRTRITACKTRI